ncbi:MAG: crossover junction endodeoxyribonuclease RuvC [bacterium]
MIVSSPHSQTDLEIAVGMDPGSRISGIGIVGAAHGRVHHIAHFPIKIPEKLTQAEKLLFFAKEFQKILESHPDATLVIESLFTAKNVSSILKVSHFRGVAMMMAARNDWKVVEVSPATVKVNVTGYGRATKEQVQFMVQKLLRLKEPPMPLDCSDALAMAICHLGQSKLQKRIKQIV